MNSGNIKIFDTTLRDGQQCPGAGMSFAQNLQYAKLATKLGVDVLEAGFPSASKIDFEIVQAIAKEISSIPNAPVIAGLCQMREEQVEITIRSLEQAVPHKKARMHIYLPVDPELIVASLGGAKAERKEVLIENLGNYIAMAVRAGLEVEFSPAGYSRMRENFDFVTDLIRSAVWAGAAVIYFPKTNCRACFF